MEGGRRRAVGGRREAAESETRHKNYALVVHNLKGAGIKFRSI